MLYLPQLKHVYRLEDSKGTTCPGSKLTNPHGNNDLNFRLARDQVEHLETAVISLAAGDKQIMFSQFVLFLMRNGKFFFFLSPQC